MLTIAFHITEGPVFRSFSFALAFLAVTMGLSEKAAAQIRVVKINVASAAFAAPSISYERVKDKQFSWQLTLSYRPEWKGPHLLYHRFDEGWSYEGGRTRVAGGQFAYRWYTRKGRTQATKPYFAFYAQYQDWKGSATHRFDQTSYAFKGNWRHTTIGLQYGVQWVIQKRWAIDLTLVGFGLQFAELSGSGNTGSEANIGLWEENLLSIPIIGQRMLMEGDDGDYTFNERYTGVGLHSALRIGLLF